MIPLILCFLKTDTRISRMSASVSSELGEIGLLTWASVGVTQYTSALWTKRTV